MVTRQQLPNPAEERADGLHAYQLNPYDAAIVDPNGSLEPGCMALLVDKSGKARIGRWWPAGRYGEFAKCGLDRRKNISLDGVTQPERIAKDATVLRATGIYRSLLDRGNPALAIRDGSR